LEIENEANVTCFWRKVDVTAQYPNAADYVRVLRAAREEILRLDPDAKIVLGGLVALAWTRRTASTISSTCTRCTRKGVALL